MIYNCFTSNNSELPSLGNPSSVFFIKDVTGEHEMSNLAIKAKTPISCFVKLGSSHPNSALIKFFAPNGKIEGFCGHGLISLAKALKDKGFTKVKTVLTESGIFVNLKVLQNGASSLQIPTSGFDISKFTDRKTIEQISSLFSLKEEVLEVFKAGKLGDLLFELSSPESLQNLKLDKEEVKAFLKRANLRAFMFFCKGSTFEGIDAEIRVFYVNLEDLEDVVCGSVNISVARVLYNKYGITNYKAVQPYTYKETGKIGGCQEITFNPRSKMLILNGFTELVSEELILQPIDVKFDKNLNPIRKNKDYLLMKELFTDIRVMKTSTAFALQVPKNEQDLNSLINQLVENRKEFKQNYGLQKIFSINRKEVIGVAGLIKTNTEGVVECGIFLKPEFSGAGLGTKIARLITQLGEERNEIMIYSIWDQNIASIKLAEKNGGIFCGKIHKEYNGEKINVNIYKNGFQAKCDPSGMLITNFLRFG